MRQTNWERGIDTERLIKRLLQVERGQTVDYQELTDLIGRDVQKSGNGCLRSARRILQRAEEIVFDVITNVGLKRLDDIGIVGTGQSSIKRIHREARRGLKRGSCVQAYDKLPDEKKTEYNAQMSGLGALSQITKPSMMQRLESCVKKEYQKLSLTATLILFGEETKDE